MLSGRGLLAYKPCTSIRLVHDREYGNLLSSMRSLSILNM